MKVKIKKLVETAIIPKYAKYGDAGLDLTAVSRKYDNDGNIVYNTGLAIEIPYGYVGLLFPRSSISKKDLSLCNSVGVIDAGYRGEIIFKFKPALGYITELEGYVSPQYEIGERVGQLLIIPYPSIELEEVDNLSNSDRGEEGYGSTGK